MKRKFIIIGFNILLVLAILFFAYDKIFKANVLFDCNYGASSKILDELAAKMPDNPQNVRFKAFFLFNRLPKFSVMETLEKLYNMYRTEVSFNIFFSKKFKSVQKIGFPYKILPRYNFACLKDDTGDFDKNYFLLTSDNKMIYMDDRLDFFSLNLVILKNLKSGNGQIVTRISKDQLKSRLISKLNQGDLKLYSIAENEIVNFKDSGTISEIYFFHADCSTCELRSVLNEVKMKKIVDNREVALVFSVFANPSDIHELLVEKGIVIPAFVDNSDELELAACFFKSKENPIIIMNDEWRSLE